MRAFGLMLGAAVILVLAGCGGKADATKAPLTEQRASEVAKAALLTAADMPAGFVQKLDKGDDPSLSPAEEAAYKKRFEDCFGVPVDAKGDIQFPGHLAAVDGAEYHNKEGDSVNVSVDVFNTAQEATDGLASVLKAWGGCGDVLTEYMDNLFKSDPKTANLDVTTSFDEYKIDRYGDEHGAFRITIRIPALHLQMYWDNVFVRVGRVGGTYSYFTVGDGGAHKQELADLFERRLTAAEQALAKR